MSYPRPIGDVVNDLLATEWARNEERSEELCDLIAELDEALTEHRKLESLNQRARTILLAACPGCHDDPHWRARRSCWLQDMGIE